MVFTRTEYLEKQLAEKEKEARYYRDIAQRCGDDRLRETEELSRVTALLKEKLQIIDKQHQELLELNQKAQKSCITDDLTGLLNRRGLIMLANRVFLGYKRKNFEESEEGRDGTPFVCALLDIDYFKKINDTYGHLAGDKILSSAGNLFLQSGVFRETDIVGRYGGDEFLLILPKCNEKNALIPLGKLRETLKNKEFNIGSERVGHFTFSIGVAEFKNEDTDIFQVIDRADEALYHAKNRGRDRIILSLDTKKD